MTGDGMIAWRQQNHFACPVGTCQENSGSVRQILVIIRHLQMSVREKTPMGVYVVVHILSLWHLGGGVGVTCKLGSWVTYTESPSCYCYPPANCMIWTLFILLYDALSKFIARATYGTFMVGRTCTDTEESVNDFHKALLFWKFQAMDTSFGRKAFGCMNKVFQKIDT